MKVTINTNKTPYTKQKTRHKRVYILLIYLVWAFSALFLYRTLFTRYGIINNIIMTNQIHDKEVQINELTNEYNLIKQKIFLIKNHDTDLIEELSIQLLNRIPKGSKILVD